MPIQFYEIILAISFIILLSSIKSMKGKKLFFFLILIVALFELLFLRYWLKYIDAKSNILPYNFFIFFCSIIYILIFYREVRLIIKHISITNLALIFWLSWYSISLIQGNISTKVIITPYLIGVAISIICFLKYLVYIITHRQINWSDPLIYLGFGITVYFVCAFPILSFVNKLITSNEMKRAYSDILRIGNIFLSLGYLGAAICIRKEAQSTG